ncbi:MAG: hypothetical protein KDD11_00570 [Acidobacteria bacterium]|nr:hypothetical protein [Acidobacteriota bacterium]
MNGRFRKLLSFGSVILLASAFACGDDTAVQEQAQAEREAALVALEQSKADLDAKRAEYSELEAKINAPEDAEAETSADAPAEGEEPMTQEQLEEQAKNLKQEIEDDSQKLASDIVGFINEDPPVQGEPFSPELERAVNLKVEEDILLAQEWIESGGDYRRAITILESLQPLAPDNAHLQEELEHAKNFRYMTEDRFAAVKKGMTEDEVREALGPVNLRNIKPYEDRGVVAWFYPKEGGGAAGVFFNQKKGKTQVYKTDFNAVQSQAGGDDEGDEG